ncbi:FxLD family lanthipeptide [Amycolatopsis sp. NPDC006125]|uniref:FxLD family lanthipeptide n=1 Tax=Amycolatopsis sp. NPDC006125 TaxID=3156730 RepID=UPI0033A7E1E8
MTTVVDPGFVDGVRRAAQAAEDAFALDVQIITDVPPGHPLAACKGNTDDGCDPTCASACVSHGA